MKNLKKVLAVMTAVSAMAASTSAFAANIAEVKGGVTGTYAEGKLSVTTPAAADTSKDMTLLVLTEGALADNAVADGEILYIDQGTTGFADRGLKTDVLLGEPTKVPTEEGEEESGHIIKVGYYDADGNFAIAQGYIKVSAEATGKNIEIVWGDVTADAAVSVLDATAILNRNIGGQTTFTDADNNEFTIGETYADVVWGDVTVDGAVSVLDATAILNRNIGGETVFGDYTMGDAYTITVDAE